MGHRSEIRVHSAWSEPPVLWFIIGAGKGTRKSSALRQVLMPLLDLADERKREQKGGQLQQHPHDDDSEELDIPMLITNSVSSHQLHRAVHEGQGNVLHVTECLENAHKTLQMHALHKQDLGSSQPLIHDLYEAFTGSFALSVQAEPSVNSDAKSVASLTQAVVYNQCGFADPEYVVNLTVKAPCWLSGRFLVSCPPSVEERNSVLFHFPHEEDNGQEDEDGRGPSSTDPPRGKRRKKGKKLMLKDVYRRLAQAHSQKNPRRYRLTKDAVHELQRFQEEEWCTIINQLGGDDNSGVVGKSMGQIVRLAGALKALTQASQPEEDVVIGFSTEQVLGEEREEIHLTSEDVAKAVELGKYFLEQKLSMTFMVSTGFFRSGSNNGTPHPSQSAPCSTPHNGTGDYSFIPPSDRVSPATNFDFHPKPSPSPNVSTDTSSPSPQHAAAAALQSSQSVFPFNMMAGIESSTAFTLMGAAIASKAASSSTLSANNSAAPSSVEIDINQLPFKTCIPATPEEEMAEMSQAAEFVQMEPGQFVTFHARRVKRLLECFDDGCGVSATTAAQKSIAPPVRVAGTNNRHPAWASALFFRKVADLGLGVAEQVRHPTNGRVYWRFKRKALANLTEKNIQLLQYLRVDMLRYARLGQSTLQVPGLDLPDAQEGGSGEARGSKSGSPVKGSKSNTALGAGKPEGAKIKQESVDLL